MIAPEGCTWKAASTTPWLSLTSDASGAGNGSFSYSVAPNPASEQRNGFLMIAGQGFPVTQSGPLLISTIAGGSLPATSISGTAAFVASPTGVAVDTSANVYFSSEQMNAVFKLDSAGTLTRIAGTGVAGFSGDGDSATGAELAGPHGVAVDPSGNLYIADTGNSRIRRISASGIITTVAGNSLLYRPWGVAIDSAGNLYIADTSNHRVRKMSPAGTITTLAGTTCGFSGDGGPASAAKLCGPSGVAVDGSGNVYVADSDNHRIRKISPNGTISTVAGTGVAGFSGDGGPAANAALMYPNGIAVDAAGCLFIADTSYGRIRKVSGAGIITTVAGGGSSSADGVAATSARLASPWGVAPDSSGVLYIADTSNNRLRKVSITGTIISAVGGGSVGDGSPAAFAQFGQPKAIARDTMGNLFIADTANHRVRKVCLRMAR